jgi:predicted ATPase
MSNTSAMPPAERSDLHESLRKHISLSSLGGDRLFGRSSEESILLNSYYAALTLRQSSPANLVLITGDSGLGKTRLAEKLCLYAKDDDGFFVRGKFDQSSYGAADLPYTGITNAFKEFCLQLDERPDDRCDIIKFLRSELQPDERAPLCEAFPPLRSILQDDDDETTADYDNDFRPTKNHFHRLNYLLKKFISAITSLGDPIIFLLDDMQVSYELLNT